MHFWEVLYFSSPYHLLKIAKRIEVGSIHACDNHSNICFWFGLMLNVPVNNFSVMLGRSHRFLGITSTFLFWGGG